jgi:SAM-dependent methyltransferase
MKILPALKRFVPPSLRPPLRKCLHLARSVVRPTSAYDARVQNELKAFADENILAIPAIMDYWAKTYLAPMLSPFGFTDSIQFFRTYIARMSRERSDETLRMLSIGTGAGASEINIAEWLREVGITNYAFECVDLNPEMLNRARHTADEKGLSEHFTFALFDVNTWRPKRQYDMILAIQSLHHFVELEALFEKIHRALQTGGYFLTDDMIGRNGHQRWPEALKFVNELWRELPDKYRYNHQLKRLEKDYDNWDCSKDGFEGIRAQDVLPLLVEHFHFDLFVAFGNIIDVFIDRAFGPNFDPQNEWDRDFIDRVQALDVAEIESGRIKPTHILAAMTKEPGTPTLMHKHLSAEFCIRRADPVANSRLS